MRLVTLVLLGIPLLAQDGPPLRILRGELVEWRVNTDGYGAFSVRGIGSRVDWCQVTRETYMTRQTLRVSAVAVKTGDDVEVIADVKDGISRCRAVTIYVLPPSSRRRATTGRTSPYFTNSPRNLLLSGIFARGNLTFAGLVQTVEPDRLVLKTRTRGNQAFQVRSDTIFTTGGKIANSADLQPQMSVYVRAGQSFNGEMEVYQVMWGNILNPTTADSTAPPVGQVSDLSLKTTTTEN